MDCCRLTPCNSHFAIYLFLSDSCGNLCVVIKDIGSVAGIKKPLHPVQAAAAHHYE
ncbi:MAG: hypothetical protein PUA84_02615 [Oscillospiraceae bacterium]|nr:hypothetical protein [Oscillospiraceae bacterium]